jgi:DNA helicase-2/ATP-dependent DNA helicase PcrA
MSKLNPSQERVVRHFGSPIMVIAGAGSGKTKTLAHKVEYLLKELSLSPDRILALTFTNKAGKEIAERIEKVTGMRLKWVGTFHSVALSLLREYASFIDLPKNFSVLDEEEKNRFIKELFRKKGIDAKRIEDFKAYISKRREDLKPPSDPLLEGLFEEYVYLLRENALLDFSDLMWELFRLCKVKDLRDRFDYILVDEFQDTNTIQYEIVKRLSGENVCVVGDPNQCIYEWRYARPDNMLRFKEDFNPEVVKLEYNYRSKKFIIEVANCVLSASLAEWKELIPRLIAVRDGEEKPIVRRFSKPEEEARWVAEEIKHLSSHYPLSQIAVLFRVSHLMDSYERALFNAGIPYKVVGAVRFFERAEVKDALSFLRLLANRSDRASFVRVLEVSAEGVGKGTINFIERFYSGDWLKATTLALKELPPVRAKVLYSLLSKLSSFAHSLENYAQAFEEFLHQIDFFEGLKERYPKDWMEREENVKELLRYLREKAMEEYRLEDVLQEVSLLQEDEEKGQGVRLMTIHASKGLEFSVVFIPRLEEGILPHEKSLEDQRELEEERRLFYVAITRAKDLLYMSYVKDKESAPSRFLSDIDKRFLDLSAFKKATSLPELTPKVDLRAGERVKHRVFGEGVVVRVDGSKAVVNFGGTQKSIYITFLEKV